MAYIIISPNSKKAYRKLKKAYCELRSELEKVLIEVWSIPETDILVVLNKCTVGKKDKKAKRLKTYPQAIVRINTTDREKEPLKDSLVERIIEVWKKITNIKAEIWMEFFDAWGLTFEI